MTIALTGMAERITASARQGLWLVFGAVAAVLLLVSLNVGSLLLVRNISRSREISIRMALGAARLDIVRSMLTEAALLVGMGGTLGWLAAVAALRVLVSPRRLTFHTLRGNPTGLAHGSVRSRRERGGGVLAALAPVWRIARKRPAAGVARLRDAKRH